MEKFIYIVKSQEMMGTKTVAIFDDEEKAKNFASNYAPSTWYDKTLVCLNQINYNNLMIFDGTEG